MILKKFEKRKISNDKKQKFKSHQQTLYQPNEKFSCQKKTRK
jgi:hypothetical protein